MICQTNMYKSNEFQSRAASQIAQNVLLNNKCLLSDHMGSLQQSDPVPICNPTRAITKEKIKNHTCSETMSYKIQSSPTHKRAAFKNRLRPKSAVRGVQCCASALFETGAWAARSGTRAFDTGPHSGVDVCGRARSNTAVSPLASAALSAPPRPPVCSVDALPVQ